MEKIDKKSVRRLQICLALSIIAVLAASSCITMLYFSYRDNLIKREREYESAVTVVTNVCNDPIVLSNDAVIAAHCNEKKDLLAKTPELYAIRDVICGIFPCQSLTSGHADNLLERIVDLISDKGLKLVIFFAIVFIILAYFGIINIQSTLYRREALPMFYQPFPTDYNMMYQREMIEEKRR